MITYTDRIPPVDGVVGSSLHTCVGQFLLLGEGHLVEVLVLVLVLVLVCFSWF